VLKTALDEFGFESLNLAVVDFSTQGNIIQLGYEPVGIDIITSIKGLEFADTWDSRIQGPYGNQTVNFDEVAKSRFSRYSVIPAEAGIQSRPSGIR
jgi:hypothetical protein